MKVRIDDIQTLGALRPLDITAYLHARGWTEVDPGGPASLWENTISGVTHEVLAPLHQGWRDYGRRVQSVIETLGEAEGRSQLAILRDIMAVFADIVRLRAVHGSTSDDTIAFLDGIGVAAAGRGMLLAAACSAVQPQKGYASRKPPQATQYLEGLRLGQSERGSYVMTVISPVSPALQTEIECVADATPDPYARRVTRTLGGALDTLHRAASRGAATGTLAPFEEAVSHGVSADLCEALDLVRECSRVQVFELSIGWAPSRPVPSGTPSRTVFTPDVLEIVHEAGRLLREQSPIDDFELEGPVIQLNQPVNQPMTESSGLAVVFGRVNGQSRQVRVSLNGLDWQKAVDALQKHRIFRCTGELTRSGKLYVLLNPRRVMIEATDPMEASD